MTRSYFKTGKSSGSSISGEDLKNLVAKKAFELYEKRGKQGGHSMDDWLEAERIIKAKLNK